MNSVCVATCNPDRDSWVFDIVEWYLDSDGFVDPEKNGKIRYYVVKEGRFIFADEEKWFLENMPDTVTNSHDGSYIPPKRFCFVQLTIFNNPILLEKNPRYLSELQNLPEHERDSQLYGNWFAKAEKAEFWKREMIRGINGEKVLSILPEGCRKVAAWDKAITEYVPKLNNTDADFSACIHLAKSEDGIFYLYGNYCDENYDQYEQVFGKFRKNSGDRDRIMMKQAEFDGKDTLILISRDCGSDGKQVHQEMSKRFIEKGYKVVNSNNPSTKGKFSKFEPFMLACQLGLVKVIESSFDPKTLEAIYREFEGFAPTLPNGKPWRSGRSGGSASRKDDWCDSVSEAYNYLSQQKIYTVPKIAPINSPTQKALSGL